MQEIIDNIDAGIAAGKRRAAVKSEVERLVMVRFHDGCANTTCRICFGNNDSLAEALELATERTDLDLLGHYHKWLKDNDIEPETEHGWWSRKAFDADNVMNFADTVYLE